MSSLLFSLLICLSMHTCNARPLSVFDKENRKQVSSKGVVEVNIHKNSILSEMMPQTLEEFEDYQQTEVGNEDKANYESLHGASMMKQNDLEVVFKRGKDFKRIVSGKNNIMSSPNDLQQKAKVVGSKRHGRLMLGSDATQEAIESKENETAENVVFMDYASPHRKPPIHNERP